MHFGILIPSASSTSSVSLPLRSDFPTQEASVSLPQQQKWLLPVDGTPVSTRAVEYVIEHADPAVTHVHVLNVQAPLMSGHVSVLTSADLVTQLRRSAGNRIVYAAKRLLERHGFRPTCEVAVGGTADSIIQCAADNACTKIVMGSRRLGNIASIVGLSVSNRVVKRARVPVTIV